MTPSSPVPESDAVKALKWLQGESDDCAAAGDHKSAEQFRLVADELERAQLDIRNLKVAESLLTAELERVTKERDHWMAQYAKLDEIHHTGRLIR